MSPSTPPPTENSAALEQARTWLRLLHSGKATALDATHFKHWLQTAEHQIAFEQAKAEWQTFTLSAQTWASQHPPGTLAHSIARSQSRRRVLQATTLGLGLSIGAGVLFPPKGLWPNPQEWGADERTRTGEQRQLDWAGATLNLNTRTSIRELEHKAGFRLLQGEAAIQVNARPNFEVHAGVARCRVHNSHFELKHIGSTTDLHCLEGQVHVHHPYGDRLVQAKQHLRYTKQHIEPVQEQAQKGPAAWRNGELSFEQTPLELVISEINRYRQGRVVLMNTAVAQEPLSGRFQLRSLDHALQQIEHTFGLSSQHMPAGLLILS